MIHYSRTIIYHLNTGSAPQLHLTSNQNISQVLSQAQIT